MRVILSLLCLANERRHANERRLETLDDQPSGDQRLVECGLPTQPECPRKYSIEQVELSAAEHNPFDPVRRQAMATARAGAEGMCQNRNVTTTGGWCLAVGRGTMVALANNQSYMCPKRCRPPHHVKADQGVLSFLVSLVDEDPGVTINDFGAGLGQYGHALLAVRPKASYLGFDGAGNVESYTNKFLQWADLTMPLSLPKSDWVVSLEVGEHVPNMHEMMVVRNIHAHNTKGVLLSWAGVGQGGLHHVNNHSSKYLVALFEALGYVYDEAESRRIRAAAKYLWFKRTVHVFRRR